METSTVELKKFDMKKIPKDAVIVFIGKRRTGKSTLVKDFFYHNQDYGTGVVVSGTEKLNTFFADFIPKEYIHYNYNSQLVQNMLDAQQLVINHNKIAPKEKKVNQDAFLVLDDCFYDDTWKRDQPIKEIFFNGRHFKLTFILTMQYPIGISPAFRTNIDYVFILRETAPNNVENIYKNFCRANITLPEFKELLQHATQDYRCIVIDNTSQSNKLEDQIYWYKAEVHTKKFMAFKKKLK